jgi:hypothetical protein
MILIRWPGQCQGERLASPAVGWGQRGQTGQPRGLPGVAADGLRQVAADKDDIVRGCDGGSRS